MAPFWHRPSAAPREVRANSLVGAASLREPFASGRTNDGKPTNYGFGWYFGEYQGLPFADHEGAWIGFRSYICRYLERPPSIFVCRIIRKSILPTSRTW